MQQKTKGPKNNNSGHPEQKQSSTRQGIKIEILRLGERRERKWRYKKIYFGGLKSPLGKKGGRGIKDARTPKRQEENHPTNI